MKRNGMWIAAGLLGLGGLGLGLGMQPAEPKVEAAAAVSREVAALAFLEGTWRGEMEGDAVEEVWSAPSGDSIIGMFRWQSGGKTTMWELLSVRSEGGAAVLRLRHFGPGLEPWKGECEGVAGMKATEVEKSRVVFTNAGEAGDLAACEYASEGDVLGITVRFKDEAREALKFSLKRVK